VDDLVAFRSFLDEYTAGEEKRVRGGVYKLALAGGGLATDTSSHVFETACLQLEIKRAVIREDEFVVLFALEPDMAVGLRVLGIVVVRNLISRERVVLIVDPDVASQYIEAAMLLLLLRFEARGNTLGRRGNYFSDRKARRVGK
jgi:hypothetical protein